MSKHCVPSALQSRTVLPESCFLLCWYRLTTADHTMRPSKWLSVVNLRILLQELLREVAVQLRQQLSECSLDQDGLSNLVAVPRLQMC